MILDAADLLAYFDATGERHWSITARIELAAETEPLVVSPFVIAELEAIVPERYGREGWLAVLDELARGAWVVEVVSPEHLAAAREHVAAGATLAGASVAVLVEDEE